MLHVTWKGLLAHKIRLATTAIAVLIGVAFMAGTLVLTATIGSTFDGLYADINAIPPLSRFAGEGGAQRRVRARLFARSHGTPNHLQLDAPPPPRQTSRNATAAKPP